MSKIIRNTITANKIYIGEKHLDFETEKKAEKELSQLFPVVSVLTDPDGAKLIPIQEVYKIQKIENERINQAHKNGYDQGYQKGLQEGLKEAAKVLQQLDKSIKDIIGQREALLDEARKIVLDLVMKISRKVTYDAIEIDPEVTLKIINGVVNSLIDRSTLKIKVNPKHLPIIEQNINQFLKDSTTIKQISIEPDTRVEYGGCFIETPTGDIDARLQSQFDIVENALKANEDES